MHWWPACLPVSVSEAPELELQTAMSHHRDARDQTQVFMHIMQALYQVSYHCRFVSIVFLYNI